MVHTLCINLLGAPNAGKSTLSSELFAILKKKGISCELVSEYAKELIYRENMREVSDQLKLLAEQHYRTNVLIGKVKYIINDAPFLSSAIYCHVNNTYLSNMKSFEQLCIDLHRQYNNLDFIIQSNMNFIETEGRIHNNCETCARIEKDFIQLMKSQGFPFTFCTRENFIETVMRQINID